MPAGSRLRDCLGLSRGCEAEYSGLCSGRRRFLSSCDGCQASFPKVMSQNLPLGPADGCVHPGLSLQPGAYRRAVWFLGWSASVPSRVWGTGFQGAASPLASLNLECVLSIVPTPPGLQRLTGRACGLSVDTSQLPTWSLEKSRGSTSCLFNEWFKKWRLNVWQNPLQYCKVISLQLIKWKKKMKAQVLEIVLSC